MLVTIKRQRSAQAEPYWQTFEYTGSRNLTVAAMLDALNDTDDLFDVTGAPADRIRWECSCAQKMCGACAMRINNRPGLACAVFLRDLPEDAIRLEPLSKFPVVADLMVDRSCINEYLRSVQAFPGTCVDVPEKEAAQLYAAAKCLKCGLCLEACPKYGRKKDFFGAMVANELYFLYAQSADRKEELLKAYETHFSQDCLRDLRCLSVCPMQIKTIFAVDRLHRADEQAEK